MSPATGDILRAALALTDEERTELIEEFLAAQPNSGDLPFDLAWLSEIQRRSAEIDEGRVTLSPCGGQEPRSRRSEGSGS